MSESVRLSEVFLTCAGRAAVADEAAALAPLLARLCTDARAAWPAVPLGEEVFVRHVAERIPAGADLAAALHETHAADLYLACACKLGLPAALAAFEQTFVSHVTAYLSRQDAMPGFSDELKQILRERLLVAEKGLLPRIAGYTGRGPLGAWLRVAAVREAIDLRKKLGGGVSAALAAAAPTPVVSDPELEFLRKKYGDVVREAMAAAIRSLDPHEATVLRLFFLQGVSMDAIGSLYRASRRSARRWVADARQKILDETRRRLAERLAATAGELDSLLRLVHADIEPSIVKLLDNSPEPRK